MIVGDQYPPAHRSALHGSAIGPLLRHVVIALGILVTLLAAPAGADDRGPLILSGPAGIETVGRHFQYVLDRDWSLQLSDFTGASPPSMQSLPAAVPDFGYTAARIWLRLDLVNRSADIDSWRFFLHTNFTQQISIYRVGAAGEVTTLLDLTTASPFEARPVDYPQMVAPFSLAPGEAATLFVAYYSQGSSRISMSVETPDSFAAQAWLDGAKNFAFYGMMLVLVVLATVALVTLRQGVFAVYAAYLASILVYISHADGVAFQYLWPGLPEFNSMASVVAGSAGMVFGALFAITFLQTWRFHPIMHRALLAVIGLVLVLDVVLWATAPQLLKQFLVVIISISALTFFAAGVVAARQRFREVRFYLFAWSAALIPASLFTARFAFGLETAYLTPYDTIRLALAFDALMMGLAVFDAYNQQRQSALEESLAHARRNLALSERLGALEGSYAEATAMAHRREESVKDTVHDLRQPMHALRLSLRQMTSAGPGQPGDVGQIESALSYMEKLVAERLADHPATGAGEAEADGAEPGMHAVLRGVADMFAPEAAARGLELRLSLAAPDAPVAAYPLMRVLSNLVSNAIKYTREGRVVIGLRRRGEDYRVEVHDTGPGLSGAAFEQALQRNQRLERDRLAAEGSGLGLAVARETVEANGWRISACERRTTGASIRVDLPVGGLTGQ